jgi:hypothetical protein
MDDTSTSESLLPLHEVNDADVDENAPAVEVQDDPYALHNNARVFIKGVMETRESLHHMWRLAALSKIPLAMAARSQYLASRIVDQYLEDIQHKFPLCEHHILEDIFK